eukprot:COSAG01_NODE_24825_length_765_cov_0.785285_1_plen_187_part_10
MMAGSCAGPSKVNKRLASLCAHIQPLPTRQLLSAAAAPLARDSGGSRRPRMHAAADDGAPGPQLTSSDIAHFQAHGYLVKRGLLPKTDLRVCVEAFWRAAASEVPQLLRESAASWVDPDRHKSWDTGSPVGFERVDHNRAGHRWTLHALGTDPHFLAATAHHPLAMQVVESLIGSPVKVRSARVCCQ